MPKVIKYSEFGYKQYKKVHIPIPKFDTVYLDRTDYIIEKDKYIKNLNTIIISKKIIEERYVDIKILLPNAKDIYVEGFDNLGGITIPYNVIKKHFKLLIRFEENTKINTLNILNNKNSIIKFNKDIETLEITKDKEEVIIYIKYNKDKLKYTIDSLGNIREFKDTYIIDNSDIKNDNLDITNLTEYENLSFPRKDIKTLIINKHFIENPRKLYKLSAHRLYGPFHDYMHFDNLKIIDDNSMKLLPIDKTFDNVSNNIYFISDDNTKYIYIKDRKGNNNNTLIYVDKNNNIKILERKEMLNNPDIEEVIINYDRFDLIHNKSPRLILIKYKNYYIIKDFDNEYKIDSLFFIILSNNPRKYFDEEYLINALKNYDLITIFNSVYFSKNLFYEMYEDYIEYKNYIDKLKKLGFTNASIKYLFDKKVESIIYPNEDNLNNISSTEIKCFNEIGKDYIKKKRLKHE